MKWLSCPQLLAWAMHDHIIMRSNNAKLKCLKSHPSCSSDAPLKEFDMNSIELELNSFIQSPRVKTDFFAASINSAGSEWVRILDISEDGVFYITIPNPVEENKKGIKLRMRLPGFDEYIRIDGTIIKDETNNGVRGVLMSIDHVSKKGLKQLQIFVTAHNADLLCA